MLAAGGLAAAFSLAACKDVQYPTCKKDKHCNAELGESCVDGVCQGCENDNDCAEHGEGLVCYEFRCQSEDEIANLDRTTVDVGSPCSSATDCNGGLVCTTGTCQPCSEDFECSPNSCNVATGRCDPMGSCQADSDCTSEEICDGGMCIYSGEFGGGGACGLDAVYFAFDSATITPTNQELLNSAAQCLIDSGTAVYLEAHADNVGTEEYNILLTERRGSTVLGFLSEAGVPNAQLQVIAKGSLESFGTNETERAQERRVEILKQ